MEGTYFNRQIVQALYDTKYLLQRRLRGDLEMLIYRSQLQRIRDCRI